MVSYTVYYEADAQSGRVLATIPALGVTTDGATEAEARAMAKDAIESKIAVLQQIGQPIPADVKVDSLVVEPVA